MSEYSCSYSKLIHICISVSVKSIKCAEMLASPPLLSQTFFLFFVGEVEEQRPLLITTSAINDSCIWVLGAGCTTHDFKFQIITTVANRCSVSADGGGSKIYDANRGSLSLSLSTLSLERESRSLSTTY